MKVNVVVEPSVKLPPAMPILVIEGPTFGGGIMPDGWLVRPLLWSFLRALPSPVLRALPCQMTSHVPSPRRPLGLTRARS